MVDITDWNDLDAAIQGTNGSEDTGDYVLQNDLDSSTAGYSGIGDSWQPCGVNATGTSGTGFEGTFDGQGFEIRDLLIDDNSHDTTEGRIGLFGSTSSGAGDPALIENLGVRGTIDSTNSNVEAGLLCGRWGDGQILRNCYAEGTINTPNMDDVGGLIGYANSDVSNSYALVDVTANERLGGFEGVNFGTVETSYSAGSVTGNTTVSGFIGGSGGTETDCYWDTDASGQSTSGGSATGLTTSEMQGSSASTNLSGFDFSGTWETVEESTDGFTPDSDGYAILQAITRETQLNAQGLSETETLTGTITQSGSGVENAYVFAYTVPNSNPLGTVLTDTNGDYSFEIAQDDESASVPYEMAVGVDFDDGTDRFGRAKTILFDP